MALPKKIYVLEDFDRDDTYLLAFKTVEEINEDQAGKVIGIYELKAKSKLRIEKTLK